MSIVFCVDVRYTSTGVGSTSGISGDGMLVGQVIRQRRKSLGMTQEDLAEAIGKDQNYVSFVETARIKNPSRPVIHLFAEALGFDVNELLKLADHAPEYMSDPRREVQAGEDSTIPLRGRVPADTVRWVAFEQEERTVDIPTGWVNAARFPLFAVEVSGDCLLGRGIADNDVVVCEEYHEQAIRDGAIVLIRIEDEYTLKAWHAVTATEVELRDGTGAVVKRFSRTADFQVIGIARHRHGDL